MILSILFFVSGGVVLLLLLTKMLEVRYKKSFFMLRLISRGDAHVRTLSHEGAQLYSEVKAKAGFFLKKQLPLHTRNLMNKGEAFIKEKSEEYIGNMRNARLLKPKNEGISEFFKNISEMEKETMQGLEDTPEELQADLDSQKDENQVG